MKIEIDIKEISKYNLSGSQYLYLLNLHVNNVSSPSLFFSLEEAKSLISRGFLVNKRTLTQKSIAMFNKKLNLMDDKGIIEILEAMREMFPKGVLTGNKTVRSAVNNSLILKFRKFIQEYGYNKEAILKATEVYIKRCEQNDYKFMRTLNYFINKQGEGSDLADICVELELNENNGEKTRGGVQRIQRTL